MKAKTLAVKFLVPMLVGTLVLSISGQTHRPRSTDFTPQIPEPVRRAQIERARRMASTVRQVRSVLREANVPFEPTDLFARNWRQRLRPALSGVSEMYQERVHPATLRGAIMANVLRLRDRVELTGDTVIIANRIVFEGRSVTIKGNHGVHFFALDSIGSETGEDVTVTIDTSGLGRREWLEQQRQQGANKPAASRSRASIVPINYRHGLSAQEVENRSGQPGADGTTGNPGHNTLFRRAVDGAVLMELQGIREHRELTVFRVKTE